MDENNLETVTSSSSDLSTRENITIHLEELLIAGNYDEAKLLLEPSQPVDIADAIGSLPQILQALAFRCLLYTSPSPRDEKVSRMPSSA